MMTITDNPRLQFTDRDDAERLIEVHCPGGYSYEIAEIRSGLTQLPHTFAVKVYAADDCRFLGFAYDAEEEEDFLADVDGLADEPDPWADGSMRYGMRAFTGGKY